MCQTCGRKGADRGYKNAKLKSPSSPRRWSVTPAMRLVGDDMTIATFGATRSAVTVPQREWNNMQPGSPMDTERAMLPTPPPLLPERPFWAPQPGPPRRMPNGRRMPARKEPKSWLAPKATLFHDKENDRINARASAKVEAARPSKPEVKGVPGRQRKASNPTNAQSNGGTAAAAAKPAGGGARRRAADGKQGQADKANGQNARPKPMAKPAAPGQRRKPIRV